jgi:hypothetical protein
MSDIYVTARLARNRNVFGEHLPFLDPVKKDGLISKDCGTRLALPMPASKARFVSYRRRNAGGSKE